MVWPENSPFFPDQMSLTALLLYSPVALKTIKAATKGSIRLSLQENSY